MSLQTIGDSMARPPPRISESDITRALRAYRKAGMSARVVYNRDGSTIVEPISQMAERVLPTETGGTGPGANEWDAVA